MKHAYRGAPLRGAVLDLFPSGLKPGWHLRTRLARPRVVNWAAQQALWASVGTKGERFVLDLERFRLKEAGRPDLAERVEWVSQSQGDGAGFDIRSFEPDGRELLIEVKTTANNSKRARFFLTANEVRCSESKLTHTASIACSRFRPVHESTCCVERSP
ncbi:MAG: DUF3883 domain-containing protein, partial [Vicinamibacterales bacterium]